MPPLYSSNLPYGDLSAIFLNCTLKRSPEFSNTEALMKVAEAIMRKQGVKTAMWRIADLDIPPGVQHNMTDHGYDSDGWPGLWDELLDYDIFVIGTPIWLGDKSSLCTKLIERLYGESGKTNEKGQYVFYGKAGGAIITGNEDGVKHCGMNILYSLQHIGFSIPPQAESGWVGKVGPGPSYMDEGAGGPDTDFTNRQTTFLAWNLMHLAAMLKAQGGYPAFGNSSTRWDDGERFGFVRADELSPIQK